VRLHGHKDIRPGVEQQVINYAAAGGVASGRLMKAYLKAITSIEACYTAAADVEVDV
jgi:hypothetical protein